MDEIVAALEAFENEGSFCVNKTISANDFDIKVNPVGLLNYPIEEEQAQQLIQVAQRAKFGWRDQTILDDSVRKVWEIPAKKVKITKTQWRYKMDAVLQEFKYEMGLPKKSQLRAELHNLLIYEPGHFFKPHQDSEKEDGMVATLVIILPSEHDGGELIIDHNSNKQSFQYNSKKLNQLSCIAFYADCYHEIKEVTKGYRIALTYNLMLENYKGNVETLFEENHFKKLESALSNHFEPDEKRQELRKFVYLLDHQYTQKGLEWEQLKSDDRAKVDALLKIADSQGLEAHLALADVKEIWQCEDSGGYYKRYWDEDEEEEGEPVDLVDTEVMLKHFKNRKGEPVGYDEFVPRYYETYWTGGNEDFSPFNSEYEGWMGNYGNTLDRWYHRAALVLWRKEDHYAIDFEANPTRFAEDALRLTQSEKQQQALKAMLTSAAPFWKKYVEFEHHHEKQTVETSLALALAVNNADIAKQLVSAYGLSSFSTKNNASIEKLINQYQVDWFIEAIQCASSQKSGFYHSHNSAIIPFSDWINIVNETSDSSEARKWLFDYQSKTLIENHKSTDYSQTRYQAKIKDHIDEIVDYLKATIQSNELERHVTMLEYVIEHNQAYPPADLLVLLEKNLEYLKPDQLETWGYCKLYEYIRFAVEEEKARGRKSDDDWGIDKKSNCTCCYCAELNGFLAMSGMRQKMWPLNKEKRSHIHGQIDSLGLPVTHVTERVGRPYKLVLTKTSELHREAKIRYESILNKFKILEKLAPHFQ